MIRIKRVYDDAAKADGFRILVDRMWPRGLSKESAAIDLWLKDVAPTAALRKWFGHKPERWTEFKKRYWKQLHEEAAAAAIKEIRAYAKKQTVTLVFGAKDTEHNNAVALLGYL